MNIPQVARRTQPQQHEAKVKSLDFHREALFALTADESRFSSDFRLLNDLITSIWYDVQPNIAEECYEVQAGSNLAWYVTAHVLYQYPTGNLPGMFLEIKAKITGEPLVCRTTGFK